MKIDDLVRPNIRNLKPYTSARSQNLSGILLDANENPYNLFDPESLQLNRYPDPNQNEIRTNLSEYLEIPVSRLFAGVGSDEIIDLLIRIFCEPGKDKCLIPEPTYGMYAVACKINDVNIINSELDELFDIDLENIKKFYHEAKMIFLCSPNNPTGNLLSKERIEKIVSEFNGIVVVDEAYIDFSKNGSVIDLIGDYDNIVVLRTFSKAWGLAGARFGYAAANEKIIEYLFKVKAPYNLNKLTARAVLNCLKNEKQKLELVEKIVNEKERMVERLLSLPQIYKVYRSDANFVLFKCKNAQIVQKQLAEKGVIIRDRTTQKKLENCLRVSIGTSDENDKFFEELKDIL